MLRLSMMLTPGLGKTVIGCSEPGRNLNISRPPLYHLTLYTCSPWLSYWHSRQTDWPPRPKGGTLTSVRVRASTLSWQREAKQGLTDLAPQVSLEEEGAVAVLQLSQVTRHEAGQYVCSADNGHQSQPVTERVRLHVEFPPELSVQHHVVTTSLGAEVELTCIVHAYPHAQLSWKKVNRRPRDDTFNNL